MRCHVAITVICGAARANIDTCSIHVVHAHVVAGAAQPSWRADVQKSQRPNAQARGEAATDTGDDDAVSRDAPEGIEAAVLEEITLGVLAPAEPP